MAAGKSTIGRELAARLEMSFVDTDEEIEREFGLSVEEIFEQRGEGDFRAAEQRLIAGLLKGEARVLSVGGGAFADGETRVALNRAATTVWLDPPLELILERLGRSTRRPLAAGRSPAELRRLWEDRCQGYAQAQIRLATSQEAPAIAVDRIMERLGLCVGPAIGR
jgi:shikimate kinase